MGKSFITTLCKSFTRNEDGHTAMMTAVAGLCLLGSAALAIDISRGVSAQVNLADASDAVALMLAKSDLEDEGEMRAAAESHLAQLYPGASAAALRIVSIVRDGDQVRVQLADNRATTFANVLGETDMDIGASATAVYSEKNMDIALVLDTTESMAGSKMASLQQAATRMVTTIEGYDSASVRMSVVPFSNYVNVGLSRRDAPWLRVDPDSRTTTNQCRNVRPVVSRSNCRTERFSCDRDGTPSTCSRNVCDVQRGPSRRVCGPQTTSRTWNGCVGSRGEPMDTRPQFAGDRIPGLVNAQCGAELQPLTTNLSAIKGTIGSMTARGNTYMPAGLAWGWRTLDTRMPLQTTDTGAEKVLVLMTDGKNSRSKQGEWHERRGNTRDADRKTQELCNGIKNAEITVYTIAYEVNDTPTRSLLQSCASGAGNFFNARNAAELDRAFREIGESLQELRITA